MIPDLTIPPAAVAGACVLTGFALGAWAWRTATQRIDWTFIYWAHEFYLAERALWDKAEAQKFAMAAQVDDAEWRVTAPKPGRRGPQPGPAQTPEATRPRPTTKRST